MLEGEILVVEAAARVVDVCTACAVATDYVTALAHEAFNLRSLSRKKARNKLTAFEELNEKTKMRWLCGQWEDARVVCDRLGGSSLTTR